MHTYICIHIYTYTSHIIYPYSHGSVYTHPVFTFDWLLSDNFHLRLFWSNEFCLCHTYLHRYTYTYTVTHPSEFGFKFIFGIETPINTINTFFVRIQIQIRIQNLSLNVRPWLLKLHDSFITVVKIIDLRSKERFRMENVAPAAVAGRENQVFKKSHFLYLCANLAHATRMSIALDHAKSKYLFDCIDTDNSGTITYKECDQDFSWVSNQ